MKTNKAGNMRGLNSKGRTPGKAERTERIHARVSPDLKTKLKALAESKGMTLTDMIEKAVKYYEETEL